MADKRYVVELMWEERNILQPLLKQERQSVKKRMGAQVLMKLDEGEEGPAWSHTRTAEAVDVHKKTVTLVAKKLVEEGLEAANSRKKHRRPGRTEVFAGKVEETIIALATGKLPEGHARWALRLLADRLVDLGAVDSFSHETVRQALR